MRVADYIIDKITQYGIKHIFLVTGRGVLYLTDAVAKNEKIEGVSVFHEQSASYAAMAYSKATNGMGACLVSTGCAATNAVTGCLCAYQDNLPVIFISGQHMLNETTRHTGKKIRTYGSQETDIIPVVDSITKYAVMLEDANRTVYEVEKALYIANHGRKGPVWIDVPLDVQAVSIEPNNLEHFHSNFDEGEVSEEEVNYVVGELNKARRPVLFVGGGASECKKEVADLVEKINIPVVYSFSASDIYGSGNKLSIGAVGSLGAPRSGNFTFQNADYVLVLGSKLCSQTVGDNPYQIAREARITIVDIDKEEHTKVEPKYDKIINCDIKDILSKLLKKDISTISREWQNKCLEWKKIFDISEESFTEPDDSERIDLYCVAEHLSRVISDNTAVITDAGLEELIIPSTVKYRSNQRCFFTASQGAMGYAIPAILGAYYGGYKDIVVVVGDGSIMMNVQELQLMKYLGISPKILVINNNMYAVIRNRQKDLFRTRTIGNDETDGVPSPDFKMIAKTFGMNYQSIINEDELAENLKNIIDSEDGLICEIMCKPEQKYFHTSYRKNDNGKIVRPSIEDLSPFMDRSLFLQQMIIIPIET